MSKLSEKQLLLLTIGITVLLTGGLGFLIWSDFQAIDEERDRISGLEQQIQKANNEIQLIPQREYRVIANREIADREVAFLPSSDEIETFWEVLERFAEESGVRISEISSNSSRGRKGGKKSTIESVPQIMSLRGTADEFLRFINLVENYDRIINVVEYAVTSGDVPDPDGRIRHGIKLALTTFTYPKKIASTIVSIPNYEKKKNHPEVKKWLSRIKVQEKQTYTLGTSIGRRDPFVSLRRAPSTGAEAGGPANDPDYQVALVETLISMVRALEDGLMFEDELRKRGDLWRLQAQMEDNRKALRELTEAIEQARTEITIPGLIDRFDKEVVEPFNVIKERMEQGVKENPPLPVEHVKEQLERIKVLFDERKWDDLEDAVRAFGEMSRGGEHVEEEAREMARQIFELQRSAKIIQEFEKRKIVISTIVYAPNGFSVAVINGKQFQEGDALDNEGRIIVLEIAQSHVVFSTEGVEIQRRQGRNK